MNICFYLISSYPIGTPSGPLLRGLPLTYNAFVIFVFLQCVLVLPDTCQFIHIEVFDTTSPMISSMCSFMFYHFSFHRTILSVQPLLAPSSASQILLLSFV